MANSLEHMRLVRLMPIPADITEGLHGIAYPLTLSSSGDLFRDLSLCAHRQAEHYRLNRRRAVLSRVCVRYAHA